MVEIFPRLLGVVYFFLFFSLARQAPGLFGSRGINPIVDLFTVLKNRYLSFPSIYWLNQSDLFISTTLWIGTLLSLLLAAGVYPLFTLSLIALLYLSILVAGLEFTNFGWQSVLFELTLYTLVLMATSNLVFWWNINFLLFRFYFPGGIAKLRSGDPKWWNLDAIYFHYLTQSMPTKAAWYGQKFPRILNKVFTFFVLFVEILVPFFIFGTSEMRLIAFLLFSLLQIGISIFGNFGALNLMALVFGTILVLPFEGTSEPLLNALGALFLLAQVLRVFNFSSLKKFYDYCNLWHLFLPNEFYSGINTERLEVAILGSDDGAVWKEYLFQPFPGRSAPFQPHLERNLWYIPREPSPWFDRFLACLKENSPAVLKLLKHNPFPDHPPRYLRTALYTYRFTTAEEKRETGNWWVRHLTHPDP